MDFWGSPPPPAPYGNSFHLPKAAQQSGSAGLVEREKGWPGSGVQMWAVCSQSGSLCWDPSHSPSAPRSAGGKGLIQAGSGGPHWLRVEERQGHSPRRSACHLLSPVLPVTNKTISLSSLSPDFNVMCPRQLLNTLNVSLTRTNPVEFFSAFPIR